MLQVLGLSHNCLGDMGVAALTHALLAASRTILKTLGLRKVGMGVQGMAALVRAIRAGCFERLEHINLDENNDVTSPGVRALVRALEDHESCGLPMLSSFSCVLAVPTMGVRALARAIIENCPCLKLLVLHCRDGHDTEQDVHQKLEEMVHAAGGGHRVCIIFDNIQFDAERERTWEEEGDWTDEDDWLADGDNRILIRDGNEDDDDDGIW